MEKTTKYLRCHTESAFFKVGDRAEIECETDRYYHVKGAGAYTKSPDTDGDSYATWFTLETDADSAPIAVLPDESLGGVLREYREVKRKASVGERIKYVWPGELPHYDVVTSVRPNGDVSVNDYVDDVGDEVSGYCADAYVVLEASDILRIDDVRYTMVDRKAAVGERVIMTVGNCVFSVGRIITVHESASIEDNGIAFIDGVYGTYGGGKYRVLESVASVKPAPLLSDQPAESQAAANIVSLALKVAELEKRNTALESRILALETDSAPACVKVASGPVDTALPSFASLGVMKSAQMIRDEIVERAKADVEALLDRNYPAADGYSPSIWFSSRGGYAITDKCEFVVNRDKRTVAALISMTSGKPFRTGVAKAAPGDVFNAHIGRSIALRRALGLEVPAEYLDAPEPEEIRVGDVVSGARPCGYYSADKRFTITDSSVDGTYKYAERPTDWINADQIGAITDDSRTSVAEDGGNSAASSALKGAA